MAAENMFTTPGRRWYQQPLVWGLAVVLAVGLACDGGKSTSPSTPGCNDAAANCHVDDSREPAVRANKDGHSDAPIVRGIICSLPHADDLPGTLPKGKKATDMALAVYASQSAGSAWNFFRKRSDIGVSLDNPGFVMGPAGKNIRTGCFEKVRVRQILELKESPFYCQDDQNYYTNAYWLKRLYDIGVIMPEIAAAHEFTHHVQFRLGFKQYAPGTQAEVLYEDTADCGSGAYYASIVGRRTPSQQSEDNNAIKGYFDYLKSLNKRRPYNDKAHDGNERLWAFKQGRSGGLKACNQFVTDKTRSGKRKKLVND
jgi:hypothetical protein